MRTQDNRTLTNMLTDYELTHGPAVIAALKWYAQYMRTEAAHAQGTYDQLTADPEATAKQDKTIFRTNAFRHSAGLFEDAADRATNALDAFLTLRGDEYGLLMFNMTHGYVLVNALVVQAEHLAFYRPTARDARDAYEVLADRIEAAEDEPLDAGLYRGEG